MKQTVYNKFNLIVSSLNRPKQYLSLRYDNTLETISTWHYDPADA